MGEPQERAVEACAGEVHPVETRRARLRLAGKLPDEPELEATDADPEAAAETPAEVPAGAADTGE